MRLACFDLDYRTVSYWSGVLLDGRLSGGIEIR